MRVTEKGARSFFVVSLILFVIMVIIVGYGMANAFNLSPFTYKIKARDNAADSAWGRADTFHVDLFSTLKAVRVKATDKILADTIQGSATSVAIVDDTLWLNRDSTNCVMVVWFAGTGAGIKYNCSTDSLYWTRNGSTWVQFGTGSSGSSTTNADSLGHKIVRVRPTNDGYVIKYDSDGDSLYLAADATGAAGDSNAIEYQTDRLATYSDTGLYIGDTGDSTMMLISTIDDAIYFYSYIYFGEAVADSALASWGRIKAEIGDSTIGLIRGVTAGDGLVGGASQGEATLSVDPAWAVIGGDTIRFSRTSSGYITLDVSGLPPNGDELIVTENLVQIGDGISTAVLRYYGTSANRLLYTDGSRNVTGVALGAANTVLIGNGATSAPSFFNIRTLLDTLTGTSIPLSDSTTGGAARATTSKTADSTAGGAARATTSKTADSTAGGAARATTSARADSTVGGAARATTSARADSTVGGAARATVAARADSTTGGAARATTSKTADSTNGGAIRAVTAAKADSTTGGAVMAWSLATACVDSTKIVDGGIGSGDIGTGRITTTHILDASLVGGDMATGTIDSVRLGTACVKPAEIDTTGNYTMNDLRLHGGLRSNWIQPDELDSTLNLGSGQGLILGSTIQLGTDITDDTVIVTLPAEWAGMVLSRGYGDDSTKYWDSVTIRGGSDTYGNYIEFAKIGSDTTGSTLRRRHIQIAIPVPMDCDTIYDVALSFRVLDGAGGESTYVRLKWSTTPFDSTNAYKVAYIERDSSNSTTFDTLSASYTRTAASRGSKVYALVTGLLWDKHLTWIRCYDVIMTCHRRWL